MTCEVIGEAKGEIDVKRFYVPGIKIKGTCEHCKAPVVFDLSSDYMSYPKIGKDTPNVEYFYCDECDENTEIKIVLDIKLSVL